MDWLCKNYGYTIEGAKNVILVDYMILKEKDRMHASINQVINKH